jgi:translation initiation factor eIF-2B subunit alpha
MRDDTRSLILEQPPDLVSALLTETGVLTPSAVSEELISVWY